MSDEEFPILNKIHTIVFDFDGIFTDNKVWVDQNGVESVRCDRSDGLAFDILRRYESIHSLDIDYFILSSESNPVVSSRAKKIKLNVHHGVKDKKSFMEAYLTKKFSEKEDLFSGVIYLGNDFNDIPVMRLAGFSVAPSDAHPMVKSLASCVLTQKGGEGFVRAFIEKLLVINKLNLEEIDGLISNC